MATPINVFQDENGNYVGKIFQSDGESVRYVSVDPSQVYTKEIGVGEDGYTAKYVDYTPNLTGVNNVFKEVYGRAPTADEATFYADNYDNASAQQLAALKSDLQNSDEAMKYATDKNIADIKAADQAALAEQARLDAALNAQIAAQNTSIQQAQAEVQAQLQKEQAAYQAQLAEFSAQQKAIQDQLDKDQQIYAQQQAEAQRQIDETKAASEAAKAKFQQERDTMQRDSAEKVAASKKAGRSATARPLMAGVGLSSATGPSLNKGGSLSGESGSLGTSQTLGG